MSPTSGQQPAESVSEKPPPSVDPATGHAAGYPRPYDDYPYAVPLREDLAGAGRTVTVERLGKDAPAQYLKWRGQLAIVERVGGQLVRIVSAERELDGGRDAIDDAAIRHALAVRCPYVTLTEKQAAAAADRPIPENVLQTWPEVRSWTWLSPLRLRGEHEHVPGAAYLVVIDEPVTHAMGQTIGPDAGADHISEVYARLRMALMADIGHRTACEDGTPVRADHDPDRCRWCGLAWDKHETPGPDGDRPTPQAIPATAPGSRLADFKAKG